MVDDDKPYLITGDEIFLSFTSSRVYVYMQSVDDACLRYHRYGENDIVTPAIPDLVDTSRGQLVTILEYIKFNNVEIPCYTVINI